MVPYSFITLAVSSNLSIFTFGDTFDVKNFLVSYDAIYFSTNEVFTFL